MSNTKNLANLAAVLDDGTSGQVLQSTGSGGVQFADSSGSGVTVHANQAAMLTDAASADEGTLHYETGTNKLYVKQSSGFYLLAEITNVAPTIDSVSENTGGAGANDLTAGDTFTLTAGSNTVITINATEPNLETMSYSATVTSGTATDVFSSPSFPVTNQSSNVFTLTPATSGTGGTVTIRFDVSDGANIKSESYSFEIAFSIVDSHYTTLLMATDGSAGDNSTITYDTGSTTGNSLTVAGDTHAGTFSPYRHGGYSTYFDGNGDFLSASTTDFQHSGNFTYECWVWWDGTVPNDWPMLFDTRSSNSSSSNSICVNIHPTDYRLNFYLDGTNYYWGSTGLPSQSWVHIAVVRSSGTVSIYQNGVPGTSTRSNSNTFSGASGIRIGGNVANIGWWPGYISDFRVVDDAVYTSNFSSSLPTERLTAVTDTKLLTCHLPYISDTPPSGGTAKTITVNGNTSTKPFGPYDYNEYDESINGGSVHYDGTGDYLTLPTAPTLGTSDFEISMWLYPETISGADVIIDWRPSSTNGVYVNFFLDSGVPKLFVDSADRITGSSALPVSAWSYLTLTRVSGSTKLYVNGIQTGSTYSDSNNYLTGSSRPAIGQAGYNPSLNLGFNGYMADLIIKLSGNSSPSIPTAPVSSSGTALHIKGIDAHVLDKSQNYNLELVGTAAAVTNATNNSTISSTNAISLDGNSDYVKPNDVILPITQDVDYTVEGWFYADTITGVHPIVSQYVSGNGGRFSILVENSVLKFFEGGSSRETISVNTGTWYHFLMCRSGTTHYAFMDGTLVGSSWTSSTNIVNTPTLIGHFATTTNYYFDGFLQDIRISIGEARETSNFTVPSAPLKG